MAAMLHSRSGLTPERERILREQWHALPATAIAKQLGVSGVTVGTWAQKLGLPAHPRGYRPNRPTKALTARAPAPRPPLDDDQARDALVAIYGRPQDAPLPPLPAEIVEEINKLTRAVVRETVVSLVRETIAQLTPALIDKAVSDYASKLVISLIRLADPEKGRETA